MFTGGQEGCFLMQEDCDSDQDYLEMFQTKDLVTRYEHINMIPLFSANSLRILESLSFTQTLYAFDFDGTLSKIVDVPSEATITDSTDSLLRKLSELAPVAIISGRSLKDLRSRLKFKPKYLVGNHGLEGLGNTDYSLDKAKMICESWKATLSKFDFGSGVEVEDKTYSLAIHYRRSRSKKEAKRKIASAISKFKDSPRVISGKLVINLVPMSAPHKGVAVLELMKLTNSKNALYVGDDDTDEDVFSLPEYKIMSVRVGRKKASRARYAMQRQSDINRLLSLLIRYHQPIQIKQSARLNDGRP